jgi:hypothetical protein
LHSKTRGYDDEAVGYFISRVVEKLPDELKEFVNLELRFENESGFVVVDENLHKVGRLLVDFAEEAAPPFNDPVEAIRQRYLFLIAVKQILHDIATKSYGFITGDLNRPGSVIDKVDCLRGRLFVRDRKIVFQSPLLFRALEKAEPERVRECATCERLFWAGRMDKHTCRPLCSNVWRAKKWRDKQASEKLKPNAKRKLTAKKGKKGK